MRRILILLLALDGLVSLATHGGDGGSDFLIGTDGATVAVSGSRQAPDSQPTTRSGVSDQGDENPRSAEETEFDECLNGWDSARRCFRPKFERDAPPSAPPGIPAIAMTDLAAFAPDAVTTVGEPGNLGVAGMPTNFVAAASTRTQTGALFGIPLMVRFTPSGYDFHYGDGSSASTRTGGQTWAALGQAQFTPTSTSHVYRQRGAYLADVDVRYTAEIDLGDGWFPVAGELTTDGPVSRIRIFEAHTALVAHTCAARPSSPGC
ncbi:hypothetical protein RS83_02640 [Microbacterium oxydans]|uniref:PKD domain-containing protein n=2 Tax=Microbacterium oxydans TaxID=82380 RepID=A0A0F0L7R4_9MICO|nr:hypothetical protein RS83_02640 [Microbacterium oxydans]